MGTFGNKGEPNLDMVIVIITGNQKSDNFNMNLSSPKMLHFNNP